MTGQYEHLPNETPLLDVQDLCTYFPIYGGAFSTVKGQVHAVDGVSFQVYQHETLGLVGESGCGKSTLIRSILRLEKPTKGQVLFEGEDMQTMKSARLRHLRRDLQIVFQDPYAALDPRMTIGQIIGEPLRVHGEADGAQREAQVKELLEMVGLERGYYDRYPHEFSGGQRQRVSIARALALRPKLILCDEPVSALDVSIQAQVLNLLRELQRARGLTYLFITHDLSVVKHISDDILVMYMGQMVEEAPSKELFRTPMHPYTQGLLSAIPVPNIHHKRRRVIMEGEITSPVNLKPGCRFAARCPHACNRCRQEQPALLELEPGHFVACHLALELRGDAAAYENTAQ